MLILLIMNKLTNIKLSLVIKLVKKKITGSIYHNKIRTVTILYVLVFRESKFYVSGFLVLKFCFQTLPAFATVHVGMLFMIKLTV